MKIYIIEINFCCIRTTTETLGFSVKSIWIGNFQNCSKTIYLMFEVTISGKDENKKNIYNKNLLLAWFLMNILKILYNIITFFPCCYSLNILKSLTQSKDVLKQKEVNFIETWMPLL